MNGLEVWASPEPTIARLGPHTWRNQLADTGHAQREEDIELLASLHVPAARYPVLWEQVAPVRATWRNYQWADRRLAALASFGIEPIVTLLHHGSGPAYTSLSDPRFPELLAEFAGATAARYPWIKRWTPINEPLTTARFSTLYGVWYPNGHFDHCAFGAAIVNEAFGIVMAMRAIRAHIPDAQLLVTEDLQRFHAADAGVEAYVAHKCERRFLSAELVLGRVVRGHPLWRYLTEDCAVPQRDLERLRYLACPIDLMGWNYYPNSERVLYSGGAGPARNVGLVDVDATKLDMVACLNEAWERLRVPMAISEVHCFGTERERTRWMLQRFRDAEHARSRGVDIRAFGAWAAFGMVDWNSLLCRSDAVCEDGIFTCAGPGEIPQPTLVSATVRSLAIGRIPEMPAEAGWWELRPAEVA